MNRRAFLTALGAVATQQKWSRFAFRSESLAIDPPQDQPSVTTVRYPYLQNVRSDRASILWATIQPGIGQVQYSSDGINFKTVVARSHFFSHLDPGQLPYDYVQYQADISGLNASTDYVYSVTVNGAPVAAGGDMRFHTAGPGPFNFLVLGDSGWGIVGQTAEQYQIAQRMISEKPAMIIHTGDICYNTSGQFDSYQRNYFDYYATSMSSVPFFPCPGNHDYEFQSGAAYLAVHAVPTDSVPPADRGRYYSYDWGNVHFVSLEVMQSLNSAVFSGGAMLRWLDNDLRSTRQFWKIVYFHQPPWSTGTNENDPPALDARKYVSPILENSGVQIVIGGHNHSYQRTRAMRNNNFVGPNVGTNYITSGGGGATLYDVFDRDYLAIKKKAFHYLRTEVRGTKITIHAIQQDGVEIDAFTVAPTPVFSDDPKVIPITLSPGPVAGASIRIIGRALAAEETFLCTPTPPTAMAGTTVTVNGQPIQLLYVSPTQIYGQLPFNVDGNITIRVTTPNGFVETSL